MTEVAPSNPTLNLFKVEQKGNPFMPVSSTPRRGAIPFCSMPKLFNFYTFKWFRIQIHALFIPSRTLNTSTPESLFSETFPFLGFWIQFDFPIR